VHKTGNEARKSGLSAHSTHMSDFKGRRFPTDVILVCVRWYCKYGISYRDLEEIMAERGVVVDHTTLFCWVQRYALLMVKRICWYQRHTDASWRVDETYVKVAGQEILNPMSASETRMQPMTRSRKYLPRPSAPSACSGVCSFRPLRTRGYNSP
jgi:hypothetical protein